MISFKCQQLVYIFQNLSLRSIFNRPMKSILMLILTLNIKWLSCSLYWILIILWGQTPSKYGLTSLINYLQYPFDETIFLLIILVVLSVFQCLFKVPLKTVLCNWLLPHNHIIQLCRHASPSPIIEGVLIGDIKDWLRQVRNLMLYLNLTSVDK